MKIGIATDHHGIEIKQELTNYLNELGYNVINYGTDTTDMVDYPEYALCDWNLISVTQTMHNKLHNREDNTLTALGEALKAATIPPTLE